MVNTHSHVPTNNDLEIINLDDLLVINKLFSAGIPPWKADHYQHELPKLTPLLMLPQCLAIGEIGLDKTKEPSLEIQINTFKAQVAISEQLDLPIIIHCVKAWNELARIKNEINPKQTWIYHGFNKVGLLEDVVANKMMISIGSSCLSNEALQLVIPLIPNEQLLIETDNSEVDIFEIYTKIALLKGIPFVSLCQIVEENFKKTFSKWEIGLNELSF